MNHFIDQVSNEFNAYLDRNVQEVRGMYGQLGVDIFFSALEQVIDQELQQLEPLEPEEPFEEPPEEPEEEFF